MRPLFFLFPIAKPARAAQYQGMEGYESWHFAVADKMAVLGGTAIPHVIGDHAVGLGGLRDRTTRPESKPDCLGRASPPLKLPCAPHHSFPLCNVR